MTLDRRSLDAFEVIDGSGRAISAEDVAKQVSLRTGIETSAHEIEGIIALWIRGARVGRQPDGAFVACPAWFDKLRERLGGRVRSRTAGDINGEYDHQTGDIVIVHLETEHAGVPHEVEDTITLAHEAGHRDSHRKHLAPQGYYAIRAKPGERAHLSDEQKQWIRDEEERAWAFAEGVLADLRFPHMARLAERRIAGLAAHERYLTGTG